MFRNVNLEGQFKRTVPNERCVQPDRGPSLPIQTTGKKKRRNKRKRRGKRQRQGELPSQQKVEEKEEAKDYPFAEEIAAACARFRPKSITIVQMKF